MHEDFGDWLRRHRGKASDLTIATYSTVVEAFEREVGDPATITANEITVWRVFIENYIDVQNGKERLCKAAPSTVNRKILAMKAYFKFLVATGRRADHPMADMSLMHPPKRIPKPAEDDDLEKLYAYLRAADDRLALQDLAIVETLFGSGLRREECATLRLSQIIDRETLQVIGKGNKERLSIMTDPQYEAIRDWVLSHHGDDRSRALAEQHGADTAFWDLRKREPDLGLWVSNEGNPLADMTYPGPALYKRFVHRCHLAGIHINPHRLRHSFVTDLLNNGAESRIVQELAGHEDIRTTMGYGAVLKRGRRAARALHSRQRQEV